MTYLFSLKRGLAAAVAVFSWLALTPQAQAQPVLFGGTSGNSSDGGVLGILDQTTGQFTQLGDPTTDGPLPGIAINSAGQMFGSNNSGDKGTSVLIRIDPSNGQSLGTVGPIKDSADDEPLKVTDIAFQPGTDVLFGVTGPQEDPKEGNIYTINTTTAVATKVGNTGLERGGLAFAPDGTLYLGTVGINATPVIAKIDPTNASVIGTPQDLDQAGVDALAVRPSDSVVFAKAADSDQLFTIDPSNGKMTFIADEDAPNSVASLTFSPGSIGKTKTAVPALSLTNVVALSVGLLACGYILLRRRSRRA